MKKIALLISACFWVINLLNASNLDSTNLRPLFERYGIEIKNQGNRGTCSVFALVGILEFEYAHTMNQNIPLSVEYLNWASNMSTGEIVDGTFFDDAIKGLLKYGICSDDLFPYYMTNYNKKVEPSNAAIKDAESRKHAELVWIKQWDPNTGMDESQIVMVKKLLDAEHPVAIGFQWPKKDNNYRRMIDGKMYIPPREGVYDGHSIIIVGYQDDLKVPGGGYFIFKNSFGKDWEDQGYGKMPYEYAAKFANDGVAIYVK